MIFSYPSIRASSYGPAATAPALGASTYGPSHGLFGRAVLVMVATLIHSTAILSQDKEEAL